MSEEGEKAKNVLAALSAASDMASKFEAVSKILKIAGTLSPAFAFVGAVLGLVECFLPDAKHEEILRRFDELSNKIDQVRDDIKKLEELIEWDITKLQYGDAVSRIELGMQYCFEAGKRRGKAEKIRYQERVKETCANQYVTIAVNAILDGITGDGDFRMSILEKFYNKTKGDRPKISALATRLLLLVCGGMMAIATYETVIRGEEGAKEITELYDSRLKKAYARVKSVTDRCMENFQGNMENDLNEFLDWPRGRSNEKLVSEMIDFMRDKYDWLENFCLVYNDLHGFDKHCIGGSRVTSLHRKGKCGVVFYRTKAGPPSFSHRYDEAYKINDEVGCAHAQTGYSNIVAKLDQKGIGWSGCAVIRRGPDLWYGGTFTTRNATIVGGNATAIILLK